jgi:hypothetical protein
MTAVDHFLATARHQPRVTRNPMVKFGREQTMESIRAAMIKQMAEDLTDAIKRSEFEYISGDATKPEPVCDQVLNASIGDPMLDGLRMSACAASARREPFADTHFSRFMAAAVKHYAAVLVDFQIRTDRRVTFGPAK